MAFAAGAVDEAAAVADAGGEEEAHEAALLLCRQPIMSEALESELYALMEWHPTAFIKPDRGGIAAVHWLCGAAYVSAPLLDVLLSALPSAAQAWPARMQHSSHTARRAPHAVRQHTAHARASASTHVSRTLRAPLAGTD